MKEQLYDSPKCLLRKSVALRLCRVHHRLEAMGYGIKVLDAYRPLSVQWKMWKLVSNPDFVADPRIGSRHNRGAAVDITLIFLKDGTEVEMPTPFDDFSEKASPFYEDLPESVKKHRQILSDAMFAEGFIQVVSTEWWHFDDPNWEQFPIEDLPLSETYSSRTGP